MNPWKLLGRAQTPGGGAELVLYQRDSEFSLKADNRELMNSRVYGSEEAMARLGCQKLAKHPGARVLIGGLGMGYSVRTALDILGHDARVVVAELVPAVVEWNRGVLADLAGRPLDDGRAELHGTDVVQLIKAAGGDYDAIMLDVDNGPEAIVRKGNDWLYSVSGLATTYAALRRGGTLAIWSAGPQPAFVRRLRRAGFQVDEVKVRARGRSNRKGGAHHVVWIATRG
jgi:spermidine synthase